MRCRGSVLGHTVCRVGVGCVWHLVTALACEGDPCKPAEPGTGVTPAMWSRLAVGRDWQVVLVPGTAIPVPAQGSGRTQDRCFAADQSALLLCLVRGSELPAERLNRGLGMYVSRRREGCSLWHVSPFSLWSR